MSSAEPPPPSDTPHKTPAPDDTAAFQAYYRGSTEPEHGILYRLLIGWWRDRG